MSSEAASHTPEIEKAYQEWDRTATITNFRIACYLGIVLMPAGVILDHFVYPQQMVQLLELRLLSAVFIAVFLAILLTKFAYTHYRMLGVALAMLPSSFLSIMIYWTDGPSSKYYAGLNLVLLVLAFVMHWTFRESLIAVVLVIIMYAFACFLNHPASDWRNIHDWLDFLARDQGAFFNNLYFLVLTGIIVVTGRFFHSQLRFREFALRYELDKNKKMLEDSNQKLVELDQVKSRFFANISHELRTPLTLLLSPLETMIHSRDQQFDTPTRSLMSIMHANGMRLLKLINDLLDLVRLESGRMDVKREPLEMNAFVRGLMNATQQMADTKGLKLETFVQPGLGAASLDRDKLEKTILNLLFNALKFTPSGGTVSLRVEKQGDQFIMAVADTGVGIAEKNLPYVFDRFWQADNSSKRKYQGVGIGLSLVKELTEIQGGKVSVVSEEGKGTTFTCSFPTALTDAPADSAPKPDAVPAAPAVPVVAHTATNGVTKPAVVNGATNGSAMPAASPAVQSDEWLANLYRRAELFPAITPTREDVQPIDAKKKEDQSTLLVADDEPDMLQFLKSQLVSRYNVIAAVDGKEAAEKATAALPDIILLDMNMPEKDGLQVCRELRQQPSTQNIPIIVLTARADEETKLTVLSAGANDFLCKPFSASELHVRIKNLVESHHYRQKLARQKQVLEKTIDQLKETETLLVQTEKMASLGRLSAGIMHEINNPLNYATTGLYTLRNKQKYVAPEQQAEYEEIIEEVGEGISRVKGIIADLKTFTHPDTEHLDAVEIPAIINSALRFLSTEWKEKVQIEQKLPETLIVQGNRNKLIQVFVNLLQNSLDALRVKTFNDEKPTIWIGGRMEGSKTYVTIRDNGEGIETAMIGKVFDPFFTTKDVGAGMGLGLTICYRIIQEYHGRITVQSERGKYCEFTLELPNTEEDFKNSKPEGQHEQPAKL